MELALNKAKERKNLWILVYYAAMAVLTFKMMKPEIEYSNGVRLVYMFFVFMPLCFAKGFTPMVVTGFYWLSFCSFCPLFPQEITYTGIAVLLLSLVNRALPRIGSGVIPVIMYFFTMSMLHYDFELSWMLWWSVLIVVLMSAYLISFDDLENFAYGFIVCSLMISLFFIIFRENFISSYFRMDRVSWINPNMLGATVGTGILMSMGLLFSNRGKGIIIRFLLVSTIFLSLSVLLMNASRGALASTMVSCLILILLNKKVKFKYKVATIICGIGVFIYMLNNSFLDMLIFRMEDEGTLETGGSRLTIWGKKLDAWANFNIFSMLFGVGEVECFNVGWQHKTHNDFVTALVAYGFIGFVLFTSFLFYPLLHKFSWKKTKELLPYFAFLFLECMVLEPIFRGYVFFIAFLFFIYKYSSFIDRGHTL